VLRILPDELRLRLVRRSSETLTSTLGNHQVQVHLPSLNHLLLA
jgi:hypothetical protein